MRPPVASAKLPPQPYSPRRESGAERVGYLRALDHCQGLDLDLKANTGHPHLPPLPPQPTPHGGREMRREFSAGGLGMLSKCPSGPESKHRSTASGTTFRPSQLPMAEGGCEQSVVPAGSASSGPERRRWSPASAFSAPAELPMAGERC